MEALRPGSAGGAILHQIARCRAFEALFPHPIPAAGRALRVILGELDRIRAHLHLVDGALRRGGLTSGRDARGALLVALDRVLEARAGTDGALPAATPGGVQAVAMRDQAACARALVRRAPRVLADLAHRLEEDRRLRRRFRGLGTLSVEDAEAAGLTGPGLRACGRARDRRRCDPDQGYAALAFEVPVGLRGDALDRLTVRVLEALQSVSLVEQVLETLPEGPLCWSGAEPLPAGEVCVRSEVAEGEVAWHLVVPRTADGPRLHAARPESAWRAARGLVLRDHRPEEAALILSTVPRWPPWGRG